MDGETEAENISNANDDQFLANLNIQNDQYQVKQQPYEGKYETFFTGLPQT